MRVLVLGGSGFIGGRVLHHLDAAGHQLTVLSRRPGARDVADRGWRQLQGDCRDARMLAAALDDCGAVVNCVAGDFETIRNGASALVEASRTAGRPAIVHMSSMTVYGGQRGHVDETASPDPQVNWYGRAKQLAEQEMQGYAAAGGSACILRPGCVYGAGSPQWVRRIAHWLRQRRVGDLGSSGDGWSNLVHVDDVAAAVTAAVTMADAAADQAAGRATITSAQRTGSAPAIFNLAAPDSPRWNRYLIDLGIAIGATPVARIGPKRLALESRLVGPPLKLAERLTQRFAGGGTTLPLEGIPPSLLRLFAQTIRLDSTAATRELGIQWTPFEQGLAESARWFNKLAR